MKDKYVIAFIIIVAIVANMISLLFCNRLLDVTIQQNREIKELEFQLDYVCSKL